jgi:hypothetical protein
MYYFLYTPRSITGNVDVRQVVCDDVTLLLIRKSGLTRRKISSHK